MFPVFGVHGCPASRIESGGRRERETAFSPKEIWVKNPRYTTSFFWGETKHSFPEHMLRIIGIIAIIGISIY